MKDQHRHVWHRRQHSAWFADCILLTLSKLLTSPSARRLATAAVAVAFPSTILLTGALEAPPFSLVDVEAEDSPAPPM